MNTVCLVKILFGSFKKIIICHVFSDTHLFHSSKINCPQNCILIYRTFTRTHPNTQTHTCTHPHTHRQKVRICAELGWQGDIFRLLCGFFFCKRAESVIKVPQHAPLRDDEASAFSSTSLLQTLPKFYSCPTTQFPLLLYFSSHHCYSGYLLILCYVHPKHKHLKLQFMGETTCHAIVI